MQEYQINAKSKPGGYGLARSGEKLAIAIDTAAEGDAIVANPAELFLTAFAACILKNVERYSLKLKIPYAKAEIMVLGVRSDVPPVMVRVDYELTVYSDAPARKIELLHRNIQKFGTIYNTVSASCEVNGKIIQPSQEGK